MINKVNGQIGKQKTRFTSEIEARRKALQVSDEDPVETDAIDYDYDSPRVLSPRSYAIRSTFYALFNKL